MLVYLREDKEIYMYHDTITRVDAQPYINGVDCLWIDGLVIEYPPHEENQDVYMYLNDDNTIRYEIVDKSIDIKETTLGDIKKAIERIQEDNLVVMGAQAEQYEGQEVLKQDMLALMSAVAELYEMVIGGSN